MKLLSFLALDVHLDHDPARVSSLCSSARLEFLEGEGNGHLAESRRTRRQRASGRAKGKGKSSLGESVVDVQERRDEKDSGRL